MNEFTSAGSARNTLIETELYDVLGDAKALAVLKKPFQTIRLSPSPLSLSI